MDAGKITYVGIITGCGMFWARGKFLHEKIQMNNFNKLKVEIYSKLDTPIKISKLQIKLSDSKLNQDVDFYKNEI